MLIPVLRDATCVPAYRCHTCCRELLCGSHVCTLQCGMFGAFSAMLHVPRHGDATRVHVLHVFPESLSSPTSAFPRARGAPMLHLFVWKQRRCRDPPLPHAGTVPRSSRVEPAPTGLGWCPGRCPWLRAPGRAVCGLGMLPPARWTGWGHAAVAAKTSRLANRPTVDREGAGRGQLCQEGGMGSGRDFLKVL